MVFGRSAAGSLKQAGHYGRGKFRGAVGLVLGEAAGTEELAAARKRAEEAARREWERARPLELKSGEVYGIELALSMGDISGDGLAGGRRAVLMALCSPFPREDTEQYVDSLLGEAGRALTELRARAAAGETLRVWYSQDPEEMCGLCWLMNRLGETRADLRVVELPRWEYREDGQLVEKRSWGEVSPGEWGRYADREQAVGPAFRLGCARRWSALQEENAPLRALVNGRLVSVSEEFYDDFIRRAIREQSREFPETELIVQLLTKYDLGIGDGWIHLRVEEMLRRGELEAVTRAEKDGPAYRRVLRRVK